MICPKCRYETREHDADILPGVCPACGIAYAKRQNPAQDKEINEPGNEIETVTKEGIAKRLYYYLLFMPSDLHESAFWGHAVILSGSVSGAGILLSAVLTGFAWVIPFCTM